MDVACYAPISWRPALLFDKVIPFNLKGAWLKLQKVKPGSHLGIIRVAGSKDDLSRTSEINLTQVSEPDQVEIYDISDLNLS